MTSGMGELGSVGTECTTMAWLDFKDKAPEVQGEVPEASRSPGGVSLVLQQ